MSNISECKTCTGCTACKSICPLNAIEMKEDEEGFISPFIDKDKCTNCGLCAKTCPELSSTKYNESLSCFAAAASDEIRKNSSSGGIFRVIAEKVLEENGYVCGAALNNNAEVEHIIINKKEDLHKLQKSKYVQSNLKNCFIDIKELLENNKKVFFCGTPCQVAGLNNFLKKDYENLLTADLVCHGVPSPKALKIFFDENIKLKSDEKFLALDFRDKAYNDWNPNFTTTTTTTTTTYVMSNAFNGAFLSDLINRKSCSTCKYATQNRVGDFTLGDFWGIKHYKKSLDDKKGTSCVLINNLKAEKFWEKIQDKLKFSEKVPAKIAYKTNRNFREPLPAHRYRELFLNNLGKKPFENILKSCSKFSPDCAILNFWWTSNYGAILTAYALQQVLENMGITSQLVNYQYGYKKKLFKNSLFENFANKYLNISEKLSSKKDFDKLAKSVNTFLVGSDQVFNTYMTKNRLNEYLLGFPMTEAKRVAISASFGVEKLNITNELRYRYKNYLKMFDYITVRETSGIDICKKEFDCDAQWLIDPVFIADKKIYKNICKTAKLDCSGKILTYVLDENQKYKDKYKELSTKFNKEVFSITKNNVNVQDWLNAIKTCEYLITDSFHGMCFAIIFNKPFICIVNKDRGAARFSSLFDKLDIQKSCLYENISDVNIDMIDFQTTNYQTVNNNLAEIQRTAFDKVKSMMYDDKILSNDALAAQINILKDKNFKKPIKDSKLIQYDITETRCNLRIFGIKFSFKRK